MKTSKHLLAHAVRVVLTALIIAFFVCPVPARAATLESTFTSGTYLIPQSTETELVWTHRAEVAQANLASGNSYVNITTNATTVVKSGTGVLDRIQINTAGTTNVLTIYDNTAGSGTKIGTASANAQGSLSYNIRFTTGLTIVSSGGSAADVTVSYR